jgi:hypothetical protein
VSTDLLEAPAGGRHRAPAPPKARKKRRRRRFSLNGLAIQLSAFALSFTLVALLVVSGSQAAFVEENEAVTDYVPIGTTAPPEDDEPRSPRSPTPSSPSTPSTAARSSPPAEEPAPEEEVPSTVVELADSDAGTAMFGMETTLAPGVASDRCIEVAYDGNVDPQPVQLYAAVATGGLAPYLDLTVEIGAAAAGAFGNCDTFVPASSLYRGTLADFAARHGSWSTGLLTWDPGPEAEARTFRFTVSVQDDPVAEGRSVVFGFSWETRDEA